jgi:hypothetical protein
MVGVRQALGFGIVKEAAAYDTDHKCGNILLDFHQAGKHLLNALQLAVELFPIPRRSHGIRSGTVAQFPVLAFHTSRDLIFLGGPVGWWRRSTSHSADSSAAGDFAAPPLSSPPAEYSVRYDPNHYEVRKTISILQCP